MATETVKSTQVTNFLASPQVPLTSSYRQQPIFTEGYAAIAASISSGSIYELLVVPSNAKPKSLKICAPDIGTTITADIGIYTTAGAVKDADAFSAAVDLHSGAIDGKEVLHGNVMSVDHHDYAMWQIAGDSADPGGFYIVAATTAADNDSTAGKILAQMEYVV